MHEIAHIVLGHFELEETRIKKFVFSKTLDREADIFTREVLAPLPLLKLLNVKAPETISRICQLSKQASRIRATELLQQRDWVRTEHSIFFYREQFRPYLDSVTLGLRSPIESSHPMANTSRMGR